MAELVGWVDPDEVVAEWADAPEDDAQLTSLLATAFEVCVPFAPLLVGGTPVPERYKRAQILQAQHLWARSKAGNGEGYGADGYMVQTYPLVMEARSLLRPKAGPFAGLR